MENINNMTNQERAKKIMDNVRSRVGTKKEMMISPMDWTLLRKIAESGSEGTDADLKNANCAIFDVSKILPTDEQIGEIVHKIAYTQQGEEQGEDFVQKVWIFKNFIEKQFNAEYDV